MQGGARKTARLALLAAVGAALLLLTELVPAGRLGLMAAASLPVCAGLLLYGPGWAAGVFVVTATLGLLLFPGVTAVGYAAFFGYYPIVKSLIERLNSRPVRVLLKTAVYGAAFLLYSLLAASIFPDGADKLPWYAVFALGWAAFAVYDWCYSVMISFYQEKIARFIK